MGNGAQISIEELRFDYSSGDQMRLYDHFSLEFHEGEVTAILGPSGVGKSTLLSLIAGTSRPNSGVIKFIAKGCEVKRPPIGLVFQEATLIPWRTVLANVLFGVEIRGADAMRATAAARRLFTDLGLDDAEDRYPFQLSGGMQQRVSVVRALVSGAKILLLDEPFSNSDFVTRRQLQLEISRALGLNGMLAVLVTHDLNDALRLGDRIVLVDGRPVRIVDSFPIEIPREQRLSDEPATVAALRPYMERIWRSWSEPVVAATSNA